jgi:hypothetical protein
MTNKGCLPRSYERQVQKHFITKRHGKECFVMG